MTDQIRAKRSFSMSVRHALGPGIIGYQHRCHPKAACAAHSSQIIISTRQYVANPLKGNELTVPVVSDITSIVQDITAIMSFGLLFGRPKVSRRSLEDEFKPVKSSKSVPLSTAGAFNAGILLVRRKPDDRKCVEKRFKPKDILNGRAEFEMFALRELSHRNVVEYLHGFIEPDGPVPRASMYMEWADRGTLEDLHRNYRENNEWPKESAVWYLSMQLANAVAYLQYGIRDAASPEKLERHAQPGWIGIVHRDIKPANIFLRTDTGSPFPRAMLGDFGQAIREDNDNWKREYEGGGRKWRSPEAPPWSYESDVWAIGAAVQATCHLGGLFLPGTGQKVLGAGQRYSDCLTEAIFDLMHPEPRDRVSIRRFAMEVGDKAKRVYQYEQEGGRLRNGHCRSHRHRSS